MTTAKEVNGLRKSGNLDLAYKLSLDLIVSPQADDWDRAAYAWCLISLAKRSVEQVDQPGLAVHLAELRRFDVPKENALLAEHWQKTLELSQPGTQDLRRANDLSRQGQHADAVAIYERLMKQQDLAVSDRQSWGWDIFRLLLAELRTVDGEKPPPPAIQRARQHLNNYMKLGLKGPHKLHTAMLQQALRLAKGGDLKLVPFLRLWGLDQFLLEDFISQTGQDGKTWPPLYETTIKAAASEAVDGGRAQEMQFILPSLESAIRRYPESVWLKHVFVKLLQGIGRNTEALDHAIVFTRSKASEYWSWELLGDLQKDAPDMQLACYAKALCCSQDEDFIGKLRLKFAKLISSAHPEEAHAEVDRVCAHRILKGYQPSREVQMLQESTWYKSSAAKRADRPFYLRFTEMAEALLFSHLPWVEASVGDSFEILGKDGQKSRKRRRVYIRHGKIAIESSLSAAHPDIRGLKDGDPISVQYEPATMGQDRLTFHRIRLRPDGEQMDAAPELIGVIDNVNRLKSVIHVTASREIDGIAPLADFLGIPEVGMPVALRLAVHYGPKGPRKRILTISPTNKPLPAGLCEDFSDEVEVTDKGFGFTEGGIFIPPGLISERDLKSGNRVQGKAILSQNKQGKWGLKAYEIRPIR